GCCLIDEVSVLALAVFTERLAVIADQNDQALFVDAGCLERAEKAAKLAVDICNGAIVGMILISRRKRLRGTIGTMGIIKVKPEKKWSATAFLGFEPTEGVVYALAGAALHQADLGLVEGGSREGIVVEIKSACQS